MDTLGITQSVCPVCRALVPAKIVSDGEDVYFRKYCPTDGERQSLVWRDAERYLRTQRYVKPAWVPRAFAGDATARCPEGCGFCSEHEQHLCLPIVEITSRCNLACPICLAGAGGTWDMTPNEFRTILDELIRTERQIDVLNLSGGEPLLHPQLLAFVDEARSRPEIVRVSLSTNGLPFLSNRDLLVALHDRDVVVSLQFDGFDEKAYEVLRGRRLLREKQNLLELLGNEGITTSLTMTAAAGVNDDQYGRVLDYVFAHEHVVSLMIQPLAFPERATNGGAPIQRLSIPDVVKELGNAGHPFVAASDFVPLPCGSPLCFTLAFYLMIDGGGAISINRLADAEAFLDGIANRVVFGLDAEEHENLKRMLYELWSGPAGQVPDNKAVIDTVRGILRELSATSRFDPRAVFTVAERRVKSIFIHAFQDVDCFDLARVRRCCQAYPQPDGKIIPACVFNVLRRDNDPRFCRARKEALSNV